MLRRYQVREGERQGCKGPDRGRGLPDNWDEAVVKVMGGGDRGGGASQRK